MKEQIISFKTAKLAKEKNFYCNNYRNFYVNPGSKIYKIDEEGKTYPLSKRATKELYTIEFVVTLNAKNVIPAPTQSLLQKWLREKYDLHISIEPYYIDNDIRISPIRYISNIYFTREEQLKEKNNEKIKDIDIFNTYEEALEDALYESLKLIKTK